VRVDDTSGDREAQPRPTASGHALVVSLIELLKDVAELLRRNARARVPELHADARAGGRNAVTGGEATAATLNLERSGRFALDARATSFDSLIGKPQTASDARETKI